ncbi:LysM peptidoglycan-binding domain-containing protein [Treponema sp.]|uniref:LysM peptidoglycan-binding domain-containing protein n=1 Tax=Treponema sp. TaxID=166 RepID=UPI003F069B0C
MKKLLACTIASFLGISVFAASYTNNTYQKLAKEYTQKAERALDAGEYVLAEEYAAKAKENAELSDSYIQHMLARENAEKNLALAKNRLAYVESIHGKENFPIAYNSAQKFFAQAEDAFAKEDWNATSSYAKQVIDALAEIKEITPLPKYYIVRPWDSNRDCFWNISGRPYVYNNPYLWENLYEANKNSLPNPKNPNLILPGMKMEIPSISGEYRDGIYSPDKEYEPFQKH